MIGKKELEEAALNYAMRHQLKETGDTKISAIARIFIAGANYVIKRKEL